MKINVTWSDIWNGKSGKTTECMVALALQRQLQISFASVGLREATVIAEGAAAGLTEGQYVKVYLPNKVAGKIRFWDRFHFVLPFSFELLCSGFLVGAEPVRRYNSGHEQSLLLDPVAA
jgi:hypothetical protein